MGRWLEKIEESRGSHPPATPKSPLGGLRGEVEAPFPENKEEFSTATDWLGWIDARCALVPEDRPHIATTMMLLHPRLQQRLAERYIEAWRAAADDEPIHHKRDNAGRRAANLIVTRLKRGAEYV